ncbi:MAG: hypothetical protein JXA18_03630, partial [Chitinispirillaceae bacterium]|nr:hypothetical protein [Chitinispirillaceae bacterium]
LSTAILLGDGTCFSPRKDHGVSMRKVRALQTSARWREIMPPTVSPRSVGSFVYGLLPVSAMSDRQI